MRIWPFAAAFLLLLALYGAFSGSLGLSEVAAGAASASAAAAWWAFVSRRRPVRFAPDRSALRTVASAVAGLPVRTARVGAALLRVAGGGSARGNTRRLAGCDWAGPGRSPVDRAVGMLSASLAPDSFVLRRRPDGTVEEHVLSPGGGGA